MARDREGWACQLSELHYLPFSLNSLDDNSVDLEKSRQEIKARWGMSWCLGLLTWGSSLKGWVSGQSSRDLLLPWVCLHPALGNPTALEWGPILAPLLINCDPGWVNSSLWFSVFSSINGDQNTKYAGLL